MIDVRSGDDVEGTRLLLVLHDRGKEVREADDDPRNDGHEPEEADEEVDASEAGEGRYHGGLGHGDVRGQARAEEDGNATAYGER